MKLPKRRLPRLSGYDYSTDNYYFVTLCTHQKKCLFGDGCSLNLLGQIAEQELLNISVHFECVKIDKYVIMPNHIHAILVIGCGNDTEWSRPSPTLSTVIGLYKSGVSKKIHEIEPGLTIWQKSFYDRIIRNESGYLETWKYIDENPLKWQEDELYLRQESN